MDLTVQLHLRAGYEIPKNKRPQGSSSKHPRQNPLFKSLWIHVLTAGSVRAALLTTPWLSALATQARWFCLSQATGFLIYRGSYAVRLYT